MSNPQGSWRARRVDLWRLLAYAWAVPWSAFGLLAGLVACLLGASVRLREGALEIAGGLLGQAVSRLPAPFSFSAITLGHVILGVDHATLAAARRHEQVHVRQYEHWGMFFIPAYLLSSVYELLRGRHPYLDNCFEREAYGQASLE